VGGGEAEIPAVVVEDVSFSYGSHLALRDISLTVRSGELCGLIGPNGAGKSTLAKLMAGRLLPERGRVLLLGRPTNRLGETRRFIGYISQRADVDWRFPATVLDVALMGRIAGRGLLRRFTREDRARALTALETPGHTRGHLVFADDAHELLFAGDHVLPRITPSIGLQPAPVASPLGQFLDSLRLVRARPDADLLPAHGPVGGRVHARVEELLAHHDVRLGQCRDAVAAGNPTALAVARVLRWTRREHRFDDMDLFNRMLAVLETVAHLDVLADLGELTRTEAPDPESGATLATYTA